MSHRHWVWGYRVVTAALAAFTFLLPRWHTVLWGALGLTSAAAVAVGIVLNRPTRKLPWVLVALALATFASGDIVYDLLTHVFGQDNPFPSLADAFYLATYPLGCWWATPITGRAAPQACSTRWPPSSPWPSTASTSPPTCTGRSWRSS
jgi:hypothetical protein